MIRADRVELPEDSIADVKDSYKYLIPTQSEAGPEKLAEWKKQGPSHQHVCPDSHQKERLE